MPIDKSEVEIQGSWELKNGRLIEDEKCRRIRSLVQADLEQVAVSGNGWEKLYRDPRDGRYWELYYPQGELHGGGPPSLRVVSFESIRDKYGLANR